MNASSIGPSIRFIGVSKLESVKYRQGMSKYSALGDFAMMDLLSHRSLFWHSLQFHRYLDLPKYYIDEQPLLVGSNTRVYAASLAVLASLGTWENTFVDS